MIRLNLLKKLTIAGSMLFGVGILTIPQEAKAASMAENSLITIGLNFPGTVYVPSDTSLDPSDAHGAVGLDHIVELNNNAYRVYDKDTGGLIENLTHNQFWTEAGVNLDPNEFAFDPRVLYDPFSERWFAAGAYKLSNPESTFLVAASNASDPTQGWTGFELDPIGLDVDVDFETIGFNSQGVFLASVNAPLGVIYVLPKNDLINGSIANATQFDLEGITQDVIQPVVDLDNTDQPHLFYRAVTDVLGLFKRDVISGPIDAPVLEDNGLEDFVPFLSLGEVNNVGGAKQPGTDRTLDPADSRLKTSLILQNGTVWGVQDVQVPDVGNENRAGIRWFQIDAATNEPLQEGLIANPEFDYFYGSIAVNDYNDVVIGFNGSGTTQFASSFAVVGDTVGGNTTFSEPILLAEGLASFEEGNIGTSGLLSLRWADYSATVVDPEDTLTFWTFQTLPISFNQWTTQISEFSIRSSPASVPESSSALALLAMSGLGLVATRKKK